MASLVNGSQPLCDPSGCWLPFAMAGRIGLPGLERALAVDENTLEFKDAIANLRKGLVYVAETLDHGRTIATFGERMKAFNHAVESIEFLETRTHELSIADSEFVSRLHVFAFTLSNKVHHNGAAWLGSAQTEDLPNELRTWADAIAEQYLNLVLTRFGDSVQGYGGMPNYAKLKQSPPLSGVAVFDAALFLEEGDERAAVDLVKRWSDSTQPKPEIIGKCPHDGRRKLAELSEVLKYIDGILALGKAEKQRLRAHLKAKLREPIAESTRN